MLRLCAQGRLRCSEKTRRPSSATVRLVAEHLASGDFYPDEAIAAFAWPLLLQATGLALMSGTRLELTVRGRAALGKPPADTVRLLWQRWTTRGLIDEFSRIEEIKGQRTAGTLTAAKPRRQAVASGLAALALGEWVTVDDLFKTMREGGHEPTVVRGGPNGRAIWRLYLFDPEYGSLGYSGFGDWPILEGRYTLAVLFEYAATLGLIDIAYVPPEGARDDYHDIWGADDLATLSRYDGLAEIRLNPLGQYALGLTEAYIPPAREITRLLKVLPDHDVVATGELDPTDRLTLSGYVECPDPAVHALLSRDRRVGKLCRPVGDRHLIVAVDKLDQFRRAVPASGYALPEA